MINRREIMKAAWRLFGENYGYGRTAITFKAIGRRCFAWCVREAWRLAKIAARKAAMTVDQIKARIDRLEAEIGMNQFRRWTPELSNQTRDMQIEVNKLTARLAA